MILDYAGSATGTREDPLDSVDDADALLTGVSGALEPGQHHVFVLCRFGEQKADGCALQRCGYRDSHRISHHLPTAVGRWCVECTARVRGTC